MTARSAILTPAALPPELPIFPLPRVVLLPHVQLPLNIFEPRYLAMVDHALAGCRMIGMIQPRPDDGSRLFDIGCAGRISAFEETDDGRYLITLTGLCRFRIAGESAADAGGFRKVVPDWTPYHADLKMEDGNDVCREAMLSSLKQYLKARGMSCEQWEQMREISCAKLVATLAVICPFTDIEKQMLLEAPDLDSRMKVLRAFLESCDDDTCAQGEKACH